MRTKVLRRSLAAIAAASMLCTASLSAVPAVAATEDISDTMTWDTLTIGGGGFVSGIVTGQKEMYLRTDVGGAYRYNYESNRWEQLFGFLTEADRGLLSVKGMAIDPTDDNTVYFLCGCAYFSDARTVIFKTTDGGKTFTQADVTDLIQIHGNGDGRECVEPIAVDPDNPDTIYAGGDVAAGSSALIKSTDGGKTWEPVAGYDSLGLFSGELKYPSWTDHMVRGTEPAKEYNQQNGIGCIFIEDGKVYVGTSVTGQANIHVASVEDDKFTVLSEDLPTENYPLSITNDGTGNLFFTYIAGLAFAGTAGGAYKYDPATGQVTDITPLDNGNPAGAIGMIEADKNDPQKLLARTCGVWSDQWYEEEWTDNSIAWGDHFFRSTDGGATWESITPGAGETIYDDAGSHKDFVSLPMDTNGYDWIYGKACHWGSGILLDPRDDNRILLTSGNGVFACDNVWDERGVQFYFQPDGVEEVVALDGVSVPGGAFYSAIGDYDGFIHEDATSVPQQYLPNIGSTSAIAYCPADTKVMARISEHDALGYYTLDAGKTWEEMKFDSGGGKLSITKLDSGDYRIFHSNSANSSVSYTDDFGATWNESTGLKGSKTTYTLVSPDNPAVIYGSGIQYNDYWASDTSKTEPTFDECHYSFYYSEDYGENFTEVQIDRYDMCDHTGDLAYISEGKVAMALGWNGLYIISDGGAAEKTDVFYCKTVGYGAPEKEGGANTLFIYGKPQESDNEGIYRSTDGGKTWVCINTDHIYGGTGNGNFLVGDMNEFGKVYMSTVGCGIVYGALGGSKPPTTKPTPETTTDSSSETTTAPPASDIFWGDATDDKKVTLPDAVLISRLAASDPDAEVTDQGLLNSDVSGDSKISTDDTVKVLQYLVGVITKDQLAP